MLGQVTYGAAARLSKALAVLVFLAGMISGPSQAQERVHILALGDSLTAGYGLFDYEGFVPQLRDWLGSRGHDVRVVNAGVSGDTTSGGLSRADWSLTPEIDAMIVTLGGNDLLRGIDPAVARANLSGILQAAANKNVDVLLVGMTAPDNYGPDYKAAFDSIYPDLAQEFGTLYFESFFTGITQDGQTPAELGEFMQPDGIHPNAAGVARIVDALGPSVEALIARVQDEP